jgi:uncharacterized protein (TIGR02246 family)
MRTRYSMSAAALALLFAAACGGTSAGSAAGSGTPQDEAAIRALAGKYADAYSKRDTAGIGAVTADDYEDVDPMGNHNQGRAAAVASAAKDFAQMPAGMQMTMTATTTYVRWINPTTAVAGGTWQTPPMPGAPSRGAWMGVAVKKDSTWKMISSLGSADVTTMMPAAAMPDTSKGKPAAKP